MMPISPYGHNDMGTDAEWAAYHARVKREEEEQEARATMEHRAERALLWAEHFHEVYERLAPTFGYETRPDTKAFDFSSPNGQLMIAVCDVVGQSILSAEREHIAKQLEEFVWKYNNDERTFLGLEDMDVDKLYAELLDDHESEVVREVTAIANSVEQAAAIRTAAESLVARLELPVFTTAAQVAAEVADLKAALSKGWLQRKESNPSQMSKRGGNLAECCDCGECALCREVLLQGESV